MFLENIIFIYVICVHNYIQGEEAKKPTRDIPLAIVVSLSVITLSYCSVAVILTLVWPYYNQVQLWFNKNKNVPIGTIEIIITYR